MAPSRDEDAVQKAWDAEVKAIEEQTGRKVLMISALYESKKDDEDDDEDEVLSLEELRTIPRMLVSQYCYDKLEEIQGHINRIGADSDDDGPCFFRMTNTASSYEYFEVFDKHYNKVRLLVRENNLAHAFEYAFALMMNFQSDQAWHMDTDDEEGAKSVARRMFKVLKELLSHPDEALNLAADSRKITIQITDLFRKELADGSVQIRVQALPR